jgi:multiple sugar transport system ATP-binding protein
MATVIIDRINKHYDSQRVIDNINLKINDGEFFVFVGPSGSGKSTILRLIAGLIKPTSGRIKFNETTITNFEARDRNVAMVFQNYALYPHKNVYENIAFGLRARKTLKYEIDRRVQEIASVLGIQKLLERWPKELSGGERQRVAIGRAMVRNPELYLLDEPLSNLDARLRIEMRSELAKIHQRVKTTFIYVTHDQVEAMTLGERIAVINKGKIEQVDTPENLYDFPVNQFVAGFIGSPPMNFVGGRFVYHDNDKNVLILVGDFIMEFNREVFANLNLENDSKLVVGIRPEAIKINSSRIPLSIKTEVLRVEPIGHEGFVYIELFGSKLVARVNDWRKINERQKVNISIDRNEIYLFLAEDGRCIWSKGRKYS